MATLKRMLAKMWPVSNETSTVPEIQLDTNDDGETAYNDKIDNIRDLEYPTLVGTTYLDHAGTTPYAKSLIESWTAELTTNLFGNPHSASAASQLSTRRVDDIRLKVLKFFKADPDDFDVIFVANATAAIKLVAEAFRDNHNGFWYGYHADAHTSLVGCRELAKQGSTCFQDDETFQAWISSIEDRNGRSDLLQFVAYPGQSNMTGRRLSMSYCRQIRRNASLARRSVFTLLDAASLVSTSPLDLSDASQAPDFTALSFYKIFGFPDLGALIVRKESAGPLLAKRYFAGGTVDGVATSGDDWHVKKASLHSALEEGTLPFHNIIALDHAMDVHQRLFGSMETVSRHTRYLAREARRFLEGARHANKTPICEIYGKWAGFDHGPIVTFNLKDNSGNILSASEVEKLCIVKGIQLRTGGLCNPGGIAHHLNLSTEQIKSNYHAGRRCGGDSEVIDGKPTGVIRISFGAMSTKADLDTFIKFLQEYYVDRNILRSPQYYPTITADTSFHVKSLSVYPIKSCGAFEIPRDQRWKVTPKGLAWDREWCLVHEGTNVALSQKKYPRMALLRPALDLSHRQLIVSCEADDLAQAIEIDLDDAPTITASMQSCQKNMFKLQNSKVCGDTIPIQVYTSKAINNFFSKALSVPCCLARYPRDTTHIRNVSIRRPTSETSNHEVSKRERPQLMLSNESPILIVSSSSVDELNRQIHQNTDQRETTTPTPAVTPATFRANIVVAQQDTFILKAPYVEDTWTSISIMSPRTRVRTQVNTDVNEHEQLHEPYTIKADSVHHASLSSDGRSTSTGTSADAITHDDTSRRSSMPGSFSTSTTDPPPSNSPTSSPLTLSILGPCQRCQMLSINQITAATQQEPFSTLVKTRRKGDGRVWFGVHAALAVDRAEQAGLDVDVGFGDLVLTR